VKVNERETLSWSCDECDNTGYVKKGEAGYGKWLNAIARAALTQQPVPAPKPSADPVPDASPKTAAPAAVKPARATTILG
jgi:hypothetical protein